MSVGLKPKKPKKQIIFVSRGEENGALQDTSGYWVFGPRTKHKWPSGDFHYHYENIKYTNPSAWNVTEIVGRMDVVRYDPDLQMDEGL